MDLVQQRAGRRVQPGRYHEVHAEGYVPGPPAEPARYIQEFLQPYSKNEQVWFCPSVGKDRNWLLKDGPTYGLQRHHVYL